MTQQQRFPDSRFVCITSLMFQTSFILGSPEIHPLFVVGVEMTSSSFLAVHGASNEASDFPPSQISNGIKKFDDILIILVKRIVIFIKYTRLLCGLSHLVGRILGLLTQRRK